MPQNQKFKLEDLKVQSFITELDKSNEQKVKGGCVDSHWVSGCQGTDPPSRCCV